MKLVAVGLRPQDAALSLLAGSRSPRRAQDRQALWDSGWGALTGVSHLLQQAHELRTCLPQPQPWPSFS